MVEEGVILEHCHRVLCAEETSLIYAQSYNANSAIESVKPAVKADAVKSVNQNRNGKAETALPALTEQPQKTCLTSKSRQDATKNVFNW